MLSRPRSPSLLRPGSRVRLYQGAEGERHATWLELFFDLVMVVAVAQLGAVLHDDLSLTGVLVYLGLFVPVWAAWLRFAYYSDQFDTDDVVQRVVMLVAMANIGVLALTVRPAADGEGAGFALSIAINSALCGLLYLRAARDVAEARRFCLRFTAAFAWGTVAYLASLLVDEPLRYVLWALGTGGELLGFFLTYLLTNPAPVHQSHMGERFGLFTIIVLGETILVAALALTEVAFVAEASIAAALAFVIAAALWWTYFDHVDPEAITRGTQALTLRQLWPSYVHGYGHFVVFAALGIAGVGAEFAIEHAAEEQLATSERLALLLGVAAFVAIVTAQQVVAKRPLGRPLVVARLLTVAMLLLLAVIAAAWAPAALLTATCVVLVALVATDVALSPRSPLHEPGNV